VRGDLTGEEKVVINATSNVQGNIVAPRVSLEEGAKFKGMIDMEPASASRSFDKFANVGDKYKGSKPIDGKEGDRTTAKTA
jgi:cytoskeletal protein CcmA (bactofilin family)